MASLIFLLSKISGAFRGKNGLCFQYFHQIASVKSMPTAHQITVITYNIVPEYT